jgi:tRNA A-37 threonylcarbamoyl transferase component Bud32/predicted nucleotidyltransferase
MSSLSPKELAAIKKCIDKVAKGRKVAAACIYGSKAAGYSRPDSDIDLFLVLEEYPYAIKYVYLRESGIDVSVLAVSRRSIEADARRGMLGEFAVGRLLHVYEPVINGEMIDSIERTYKRRVILEELENIVNSAGILGTEIMFPLEYIAFAKIKRRISLYPSAVYSYYKTYAGPEAKRNLNFALGGYRKALQDIISEDSQLFSRNDDLLQISEKRIAVHRDRIRLKLTKSLQEFSSYIVQTYAGRRIYHLAIKEAESKIRRHARQQVELPAIMEYPRREYWRLAEGKLVAESKDWLADLMAFRGTKDFAVSRKRRLGNVNSRTVLYVVRTDSGDYKIVVKDLARTKSVKWAVLSLWTSPIKRFKVDPISRLGSEYRAIRYVRGLGLCTPAVEAVVLDRKLLVTRFVEGRTLADVIRSCIKGNDELYLLGKVGSQVAMIHNAGASFGNIKPKNVIVSEGKICFTDLEQFIFSSGDQIWDLAQFLGWGLKAMRNSSAAAKITNAFLRGYLDEAKDGSNVGSLSRSRRYIESFYPVLVPSVARAIKKELRDIAR